MISSVIASSAIVVAGAGEASAVSDSDWLGVVNSYRAMSGLSPVDVNGEWSAQAEAHSCYMLQNGIAHDEIPGKPGYTPGGDIAGNSGNVAVSSSVSASPRNHIDLWMTGPFHAIGVLRHNLRAVGFGLCASSNTPTPWHSGATLDVLRGLDSSPRPGAPIVFPGNATTVPLHSFVTEFPNPMTMCNWSGSAGLPLIAMMPADVTTASASLIGPNGPIEVCVLHKDNIGDATARSIVDGENAVIVMPRAPLADGAYSANVNSNGGSVQWTFNVDRDAPLSDAPAPTPPPPPVDATPATDAGRFSATAPFRFVDSRIGQNAVKLTGGAVTTVHVTDDPNVVAVSANFVSTESSSAGFLTTYNCATERPQVSTLGFRAGAVVANQTFVPLDGGSMCLYSPTDTHVVVDINGYFIRSGGAGFSPLDPVRLYDSRETVRLSAGEERVLRSTGGSTGVPSGSAAVALNLTTVLPSGNGFARVYPCGSPTASEISSINFGALEVRSNTVVTPVSAEGTVCVQSNIDVDIAVDLFGYFKSGTGYRYQPLTSVRMFDSRLPQSALNEATGGTPIGAGQTIRLRIAGRQGVPSGARAASVNVTLVDAGAASYVTVYPCGSQPPSSNVNITPSQGVTANGAMVKLSSQGDLCLFTPNPVHIVLDINGVWL